MNGGRTILESVMGKRRKNYQVRLIVPDNGIPTIEYHPARGTSKPRKSIQFVDLLFTDKKHDTDDKFALSIYTTEKTTTFLAKDETTLNEWLTRIREYHTIMYPDLKRYDAIFEGQLLEKGLAKTMNIHGQYRLALCKDSLDLIPLVTSPQNQLPTKPIVKEQSLFKTPITTLDHPHVPQHLPNHQRFCKRHPLLMQKKIELALRSIRRCGHTRSNLYIESGRHSQVGEGDLWMGLNKMSTARHLHELLLATMKLASTTEDTFLYKAPRSRSGSSSEHRSQQSQQSRSSSLVCLNTELPVGGNVTQLAAAASAKAAAVAAATAAAVNTKTNCNNNIDEDSGYLPMA